MISIHAPVKGVTDAEVDANRVAAISIHAPVKGVTRKPPPPKAESSDFNPRTREGCDGAKKDE